eukprot:5276509-Lingulodinium_polyedra.AAC.1
MRAGLRGQLHDLLQDAQRGAGAPPTPEQPRPERGPRRESEEQRPEGQAMLANRLETRGNHDGRAIGGPPQGKRGWQGG